MFKRARLIALGMGLSLLANSFAPVAEAHGPTNRSARDFVADWQTVFPGAPRVPTTSNWPGFVAGSDPSLCRAWISRVARLVNQYGKDAAFAKSDDAERRYQEVQDILFRQLTESSPCQEAAMAVYLVGAASLLYPSLHSIGPEILDEAGWISERNWELALTAAALSNRGQVRFLTPSLRSREGGEWNAQSGGAYTVSGAYDCEASRIYIDATLRPFDLAATFVHELDHLYRDKRIDPASADAPIDWASFVLADEFIAIATAAGMERGMQDASSVTPRKKAQPYRLQKDLSLYSPDGPFAKLMAMFVPRNWSQFVFFGGVFLEPGEAPSDSPREIARRQNIEQIDSIVAQAYFPETGLTEAHRKSLESMRWVAGKAAYARTSVALNQSARLEGSFPFFFGELMRVRDESAQPSRSCLSFRQAIEAGDLGSYLGSTLPHPISPGNGGVRPGQGGVRPGNGGVRPGSGVLRPCLRHLGRL